MHKNIKMIFYRNANFQRNFEQQFFFKYNQFITYKNTKTFFHRNRKFKWKHLKFSYFQFLEYKPHFLHFLYFLRIFLIIFEISNILYACFLHFLILLYSFKSRCFSNRKFFPAAEESNF